MHKLRVWVRGMGPHDRQLRVARICLLKFAGVTGYLLQQYGGDGELLPRGATEKVLSKVVDQAAGAEDVNR